MGKNNIHTQDILTEYKWMGLIGSPDPEYNIRGTIKETSYIKNTQEYMTQ